MLYFPGRQGCLPDGRATKTASYDGLPNPSTRVPHHRKQPNSP